jgi:transposase
MRSDGIVVSVDDIDTAQAIAEVKRLLQEDKSLSPALRTAIEVMIFLVTVLTNRLALNSRNSSKPPSSDFGQGKKAKAEKNKDAKKTKASKAKRKPGGQPGRNGVTLELVKNPDEVIALSIDRRTLPREGHYQPGGVEIRQVFSLRIKRFVSEYQAEILIDEKANRYVASFPEEVGNTTQYAPEVKAHGVYLSQYQLLPYERIARYFSDIAGLPISPGSLCNFNQKAYELLEEFDRIVKQRLIQGDTLMGTVLNTDETGINVNGETLWLHVACNTKWTYFYPHTARGKEAMDEMGILPAYRGTLCHDHWKAYFQYVNCIHALCNAHHLRELTRAWEQDGQRWAKNMKALLIEMRDAAEATAGALSEEAAKPFIKRYRNLLTRGNKECPRNTQRADGKRGKIAQTKSRNLLERLRDYEQETLRFLTNPQVPFTNNLGENDIRMTKVQQKVSGCFRSLNGAKIFCRIRSFLVTCRKHGVSPAQALSGLFAGRLPDFVT